MATCLLSAGGNNFTVRKYSINIARGVNPDDGRPEGSIKGGILQASVDATENSYFADEVIRKDNDLGTVTVRRIDDNENDIRIYKFKKSRIVSYTDKFDKEGNPEEEIKITCEDLEVSSGNTHKNKWPIGS